MNNKYTPMSVSETDMIFSIPLYQRLFEWGKDQITTLLTDLYSAYKHSKDTDTPYYVGMLTAIDNNERELVDGQQRFTVTTLMGIVMRKYCSKWDDFLMKNGEQRLKFKARQNDQEYVKSRINRTPSENCNMKMMRGIECIEAYLKNDVDSNDLEKFCEYVFRNLTFFISELPKGYQGRQLNKYFESMNATGKNLENHEILKVDIIKKIDGDKELYTRIWNIVADMDKPLIRKRTIKGDKEDTESLRNRYAAVFGMLDDDCKLLSIGKQQKDVSILNDLYENSNSDSASEFPTIGEIAPRNEKPKRVYRNEGYRSMLRFTNFILQILWIELGEDAQKDIEVNKFFDNNNLLETFKKHGKNIDGAKFILALLKYRLLYDYYVIRISNEREDYHVEAGDTDEDDRAKTKLKQFESLLYVYSSDKSYYLWFEKMMRHLYDYRDVSCASLLRVLKDIDNEIHDNKIPEDADLTYQKIDRYWFWRLDYYIWENRDEFFGTGGIFENFSQYKPLVDNYILRRNRSIEHVSPQHPAGHDALERLDDFGNLVMISAGMNTSLSNSEYAEKRGHVEACMANGLLIESLAMILLYKKHGNDVWTDTDIENRSEQMKKILKDSFCN